jgi:DEAD/DEAH box helicase domain-containing protein
MPGHSPGDEPLPALRAPRRQDAPRRFDQHGAKEVAVEAALDRLVPGDRATYPDSPDRIVTAVRRLEAIPAQHAPFPDALDPRLRSVLVGRGLEALYTHQAEAVAHALAGRHVVITTPTASGKTLCYNVPVLQAILNDQAARALYLFPTKALAQDQLAALDRLSQALSTQAVDLGVFTYDGDTPQDARRSIRNRAHVVLTNPDMLHSGILPHHPRWAKLFENLRFIVLDELHTYRGVFGSHLANVLRRLQRICRHYGSDPVFICSSATIANPAELAERLTGVPFELVERSGAPRGEKLFVFVNPPVVNQQLGIRRSYLAETRRVSLEFLRRNLQIIVFAQSRLTTEILTRYLKDAADFAPGASDAVRGYRGGYLPKRRREIEKGLRDGEVRAVVATSALELGIDIGALDVAVLAGYPGTIAATWQRAGRAGRRSGRSAAVMVASSAPLDQFIVRNPSYFFDASPEHALINPDNLHILLDHIKCAAFELPFGAGERFGGEDLQEILTVLAEEGFVHLAAGESGSPEDARWHWTSESYPADAVSLRSVSSDNFVVVDMTDHTKVIGETDFTSALTTLHPKAIYIVEGRLFQVEKLDFEGRKAYVREVDCDYYTDAITYTKVTPLDCFESTGPSASGAGGEGGVASHGEVHVVSRTVGFKKIKFYTNENVGSGELDLPEHQMHTTAFWLTVPHELMVSLPFESDDRRDGVVGVAFAMGQVAQLLLMCDRHDIGVSVGSAQAVGETKAIGPSGASSQSIDADHPRVFVYDSYPGGIGFSEPLYRMTADLLAKTRELIAGCPCDNGCPSCVGPLGETGPLAKTVALGILSRLPSMAVLPLSGGGGTDGRTDDDISFPASDWA